MISGNPAVRAATAAPPSSGIPFLLHALAQDDDAAFQADILKGINAALAGRRSVEAPAEWGAVRGKLLGSADEAVRDQARALGIVFGDAEAFEAVRRVLADALLPSPKRRAALDMLL